MGHQTSGTVHTTQQAHIYSFVNTGSRGWCILFLLQIEQPRDDRRLHRPHVMSEITKYMDAAWRQKEQENMQQ